jgi:hypothetical protein
MNIALRDLFLGYECGLGSVGWYAKSLKCSFRNILYWPKCTYSFVRICKSNYGQGL